MEVMPDQVILNHPPWKCPLILDKVVGMSISEMGIVSIKIHDRAQGWR